MAVNGRHARVYYTGRITDPTFWMPVPYHRSIKGKTRQLTLSPRLLRRVLREDA